MGDNHQSSNVSWFHRILEGLGSAAVNLFLLTLLILAIGLGVHVVSGKKFVKTQPEQHALHTPSAVAEQSGIDRTGTFVQDKICRPITELVGRQMSAWLLTDGYRVAGDTRNTLETLRDETVGLLPSAKVSGEVAQEDRKH